MLDNFPSSPEKPSLEQLQETVITLSRLLAFQAHEIKCLREAMGGLQEELKTLQCPSEALQRTYGQLCGT